MFDFVIAADLVLNVNFSIYSYKIVWRRFNKHFATTSKQ